MHTSASAVHQSIYIGKKRLMANGHWLKPCLDKAMHQNALTRLIEAIYMYMAIFSNIFAKIVQGSGS